MNCPKCNQAGPVVFECEGCGRRFDAQKLEELRQLEHLLAWLDEHNLPGLEVRIQLDALKREMALLKPEKPARPVAEIARDLALLYGTLSLVRDWQRQTGGAPAAEAFHSALVERVAAIKREVAGRSMTIPKLPKLELVDHSLRTLSVWIKNTGNLQLEPLRQHLRGVRNALLHPQPQPAPQPRTAATRRSTPLAAAVASKAAKSSRPVPPAKPRGPLVDWGKLWEKTVAAAVSGALLRGLLYLGAFMIVVSAAILVVHFWDVFSRGVQLGFIAAVPAGFYLVGWLLRRRFGLQQAGQVMSGIGALLVAVDFAAVYQFGGLAASIPLPAYWLTASLFCSLIYAATMFFLRTEFFATIMLLGVCNSVVALTRWLSLPLEWSVASLSAAAVTMVAAAMLSKRRTGDGNFQRAAERMAQVLLLPSLLLVMLVPGEAALGQTVAFVCATVAYALLAGHFLSLWRAHVAVWSSVGVVACLMRVVSLPVEWLATVTTVMAGFYLFSGRWVARYERHEGLPYHQAYTLVGSVLLVLSTGAGLITLYFYRWPGIGALTVAVVVLAIGSVLFRQPLMTLAAAGLFVLPFGAAVWQGLLALHAAQAGAWLVAGLTVLALGYLGLAVILRRRVKDAEWLNLVAQLLLLLALFGLFLNYAATVENWFADPTLFALALVMGAYAVSALIHDSGRHPALSCMVDWLPTVLARSCFLWPVALLLPVWLSMWGWRAGIARPWLGALLAGLGLVYMGLGQALGRREVAYRMALHACGYGLVPVVTLMATGNSWAMLTTLTLGWAILLLGSLIYRRVYEVALAAVMFIWPFQLALELSPLTLHVYSLAYALLVVAIYTPAGSLLRRADESLAIPVRVVGHLLSIYAVLGLTLGRFGVYPMELRWVGLAVPLLLGGVQLVNLYWYHSEGYAWAAVAAVPIAFWQLLDMVGVPVRFHPAGWLILSYVLIGVEWGLACAKSAVGVGALRRPLVAAGLGVAFYGLCMTGPTTVRAVLDVGATELNPAILAQMLGVGLTVFYARVHRNRWSLYVEPILAWIAVTLFFIGYGERVLGQSLVRADYTLVWTVLGAIHMGAAVVLDSARERYAHGLYLAAYLMVGWALLWSLFDQPTNLYVLAVAIAMAASSHTLVHRGRHRSFEDFIRLVVGDQSSSAARIMRTLFLFFAVYAFPLWLLQFFAYHQLSLAWRGMLLALLAPLYLASGWQSRRLQAEYGWTFFSATFGLTVAATLIPSSDLGVLVCVLVLNALVYAASAVLFRRVFWLYLAGVLLPAAALLLLYYHNRLLESWTGGVLILLSLLYLGLGQWLERQGSFPLLTRLASSFARPFFLLAQVLSVIALVVAIGDTTATLLVFPAGSLFYALCAWRFRQPLFIYPTVILLLAPYHVMLTSSSLPDRWYGLAWLPMILGYLAIGRGIFHRNSLNLGQSGDLGTILSQPAVPFYLTAYTLSLGMVLLSAGDWLVLMLALVAAAALYGFSGLIFWRPGWLYPSLLAAHLSLAAYLTRVEPARDLRGWVLPFVGLTWLLVLLGYVLDKGRPARDCNPETWPWVDKLASVDWAQPFLLFAALDLLLWQLVSLADGDTAMMVGVSGGLLLGGLAVLWRDRSLPYGALFSLALSAAVGMFEAKLSLGSAAAWTAGIGLGLYLLARLLHELLELSRLGTDSVWAIWVEPLERAAVWLNGLALCVGLPALAVQPSAYALILVFGGSLVLAVAYRGGHYPLGYLGVAMLEAAWILLLVSWDVDQPQLYAVPVGLYLTGVGVLESKRKPGLFAVGIEALGVALPLLTTFIQSLNSEPALFYFLLLLSEGLIVIGWGVWQRSRIPFFVGLGASVLNVVAQLVMVIQIYEVNRWFVILGVGLTLVGAAVVVERERDRIVSQAQQWRGSLAGWR